MMRIKGNENEAPASTAGGGRAVIIRCGRAERARSKPSQQQQQQRKGFKVSSNIVNQQKRKDKKRYEANWDKEASNRLSIGRNSTDKRKKPQNQRYEMYELSGSEEKDPPTNTLHPHRLPIKKKSRRPFHLDPKNLKISTSKLRDVSKECSTLKLKLINQEQSRLEHDSTEEESAEEKLDALIKKKKRFPDEAVEIIPFPGNDSTLEQYLEEHFESFDKVLKLSMPNNPKQLVSSLFEGHDVRVKVWRRLGCRLGKAGMRVEEVFGLCLYHVDSSHFKSRVVRIVGMYTNEIGDFLDWMNHCTEYIFSNDQCKEITVDVIHYICPETGKIKLDTDLKSSFKLAGYRWKMLRNCKDGSRSTVFVKYRDEKVHPIPPKILEPLKSTNIAIVSQNGPTEENSDCFSRSQRYFKTPYSSEFILLSGILEHVKYQTEHFNKLKLSKIGPLGDAIDKLKTVENFRILDILKHEIDHPETLSDKLRDLVGEEINLSLDFEANNATTLTSQKTAIRLKCFAPGYVLNSKYMYIRSRYTKKLILPKTFSSVYLLPTFQKDQRIFVINLTSERAKKFKLSDLLASVVNFDDVSDSRIFDTEDDSTGYIWIPQFIARSAIVFNDKIVQAFKSGTDLNINSICTISKIELSHSLYEDSLAPAFQEDDVLINNEFVIGVVNKELLTVLEMPVFMTLIKQDHFLTTEFN